jgi:transcriptional regulator with XRE-family HTH domain
MASFRSAAYDAFVAVLISQRESLNLSQTDVAKALPRWLGFDFTTVNKIEHRRRNVSIIEGRELARVLKTTVGDLDQKAQAVEQAMIAAGRPSRPAKRKKPRRKR